MIKLPSCVTKIIEIGLNDQDNDAVCGFQGGGNYEDYCEFDGF